LLAGAQPYPMASVANRLMVATWIRENGPGLAIILVVDPRVPAMAPFARSIYLASPYVARLDDRVIFNSLDSMDHSHTFGVDDVAQSPKIAETQEPFSGLMYN